MNKDDLKKYYCSNCDAYYNEPATFKEDRSPYGEASNSSWLEELEGCPSCHSGLSVVYFCPRCDKFKSGIDYYPFAEEYMCDDCYDEMVETGGMVEEAMEGVINNELQSGLPE